MKKTKLFFVGAAILIGGGTAVHAQSWRNDGAVSLDKQYADYPCVNLLDSTSVTVEPTGQGSFAVCRAVRVQTTAGALQQFCLKLLRLTADGIVRPCPPGGNQGSTDPCNQHNDQQNTDGSI